MWRHNTRKTENRYRQVLNQMKHKNKATLMVRFLQQNDEEIDKNSKRLTDVTSLGNCQPENPKNAAKYKIKHTKRFSSEQF